MEDKQEHADEQDTAMPASRPKRRNRLRRALFVLTIISILAGASLVGAHYAYQGPTTLDKVVAVMPGVPLFPMSTLSPRNRGVQRALALSLLLLRRQGVRQADAALVESPAESDFIVEWYLQTAPTQNWQLVKKDTLQGNTRMLFRRNNEGLQVLVGPSNGLQAPVQLIYLNGLTAKHLRELQR